MPHSVQLGDFQLTVVSDGNYVQDAGAFFGVVPRVLWEKRLAERGLAPDALNRIPSALNSLLIRTGERTVLVETGIGNKLDAKLRRIFNPEEKLLAGLSAAGVEPEDVHVVINSHLHFDHCGWNTVRRGGAIVPTFPNATYYVQRGEWMHARRQHERDRVSYISENYDPLVESGQMVLLDGDAEILPGISVSVYPGHTANLQAIMIESRGQTACYLSDLVPTISHLDLTWVMAYDLFPLDSIESRRRFYSQALDGNWLVVFTHDPLQPLAYLERSSSGRVIANALEPVRSSR